MKKLYTTYEWKVKELLRRRRRARRKADASRKKAIAKAIEEYRQLMRRRSVEASKYDSISVIAPSSFSIVRSPDSFIRFIDDIKEVISECRHVHINMANVVEVTPETATICAALFMDPGFAQGCRIYGNNPVNEEAKRWLIRIGFFDQAEVADPEMQMGDEASLTLTKSSGRKVAPKKAAKLIQFATERILGNSRTERGSYVVCIESICNTHNHAGKDGILKKKWAASAFADTEERVAHYAVVDTGYGIFNSGLVRKLRYKLRGNSDVDLMRKLFEGSLEPEFRTRTQNRRRGRGLPAMRRELERGRINDLVVVSNGVYASLPQDRFMSLGSGFDGTIVYWSNRYDNEN